LIRCSADGELAEPPWQNAAVVGAQTRHHHHPRALGRGGNANASGVTGAAAAAWVPESGALGGGDVYARLWHDMAQLEGRVDGDTAAAPWPAARPPGPSTSGRIAGTGAPLKRGRDELDTHGEVVFPILNLLLPTGYAFGELRGKKRFCRTRTSRPPPPTTGPGRRRPSAGRAPPRFTTRRNG
jgi:hypothetical protein